MTATSVFATVQSVHQEVFAETLVATNALKPDAEKYLCPSAALCTTIQNNDTAQFTFYREYTDPKWCTLIL